jgi:hypothetical protein
LLAELHQFGARRERRKPQPLELTNRQGEKKRSCISNGLVMPFGAWSDAKPESLRAFYVISFASVEERAAEEARQALTT